MMPHVAELNLLTSEAKAAAQQITASRARVQALLQMYNSAQWLAGLACAGEMRYSTDCEMADDAALMALIDLYAEKDVYDMLVGQLDLIKAQVDQVNATIDQLTITIEQLKANLELIEMRMDQNQATIEMLQQEMMQNDLAKEPLIKEGNDLIQARKPIDDKLAESAQARQELYKGFGIWAFEGLTEKVKDLAFVYQKFMEGPPGLPETFKTPTAHSVIGVMLLSISGGPQAAFTAVLGGAFLYDQVKGLVEDLALSTIINDPPDFKFDSVFEPQAPDVEILETFNSLPEETRRTAIDGFQAGGAATAYLNAIRVTLERYNAAVIAREPTAARHQRGAVLTYLRSLRENLGVYTEWLEVQKGLIDANPAIDLQITEDRVKDFLAELQNSGFPQSELSLMRDFGMTDDQIEQSRQKLLEVDASQPEAIHISTLLDIRIEFMAYLLEMLDGVLPPNQDPISDAGGPYFVKYSDGLLSGAGVLDGRGSKDPDMDVLKYRWSTDSPNVTINDASSATPTIVVANEMISPRL